MVKFGMSIQTVDTLGALNFVKKNRPGDLSFGGNFLNKNLKFLRYLAT